MATTSLSLKQHLLQGGKSYGTLLMSNSPIIAELMASIPGYSHIIVDHEHSPSNLASSPQLLQAIRCSTQEVIDDDNDDSSSIRRMSTTPIVRTPSHSTSYIKQVLDSMRLPGGLLVPMVDTAEQAAQIVQATRYPAQHTTKTVNENQHPGTRGFAAPFVRATNFGLLSTEEYFRQCQEDLLVMLQVETVLGVENIEEIANVEGVDMIFIGPMDLSCSIGKTGQFDDGVVKEILQQAERKVRDSSVMLGGFRPPGRDLNDMFGPAGYDLVCGSIDMALIREAAKTDAMEGQSYL